MYRITVFLPVELPNVKLGDTIQWNWVNGSHTTTSVTIPSGAASWDSPISSAVTSFQYVPAVTGAYLYKCTPHVAMGMVGSFIVLPNLGISDSQGPPDISISPNPFSDKVLVTYRSPGSLLSGIKVFDLTGRVVRDIEAENTGSTFTGTLDLQDLQNGIYFVRFIDKNDKNYVRRIIKY